MLIQINTLRDLTTALAKLSLSPDPNTGGGAFQALRFEDGDRLALNVVQEQFGDVVTLVKITAPKVD
jgi:hypothetical protein